MKKEQLLFNTFAQDLLKYDFFNDWVNNIFNNIEIQTEDIEEELNEWLEDFDCGDDYEVFLAEETPFVLAHSCGYEKFIEYLNHYFDAANKYYSYWEYEYTGYGNLCQCLYPLDPYILILCNRYFNSINETAKAILSCFYLLCGISYDEISNEDSNIIFYDICENIFDSIKSYIHADWQAVHPLITWNIGKYYLLKQDYEKAREFFELGAYIDYDGRQSMEPFIAVGKNQYELGMIYYKGLGVEQNPEIALEFFNWASDNAGEPTIPVIQDMKEDKLIPFDNDPFIDRLYGYGSFNINNRTLDVYYKELNDNQFEKLRNTADFFLTQEGLLDFDLLRFLNTIYKYRFYDLNKCNLIETKMFNLIKSTKVEDRTENMDQFYVSYWMKEWEKKPENPLNNSINIPKDPRPGDIFLFGTFNNEPIEWRVLEVYDNGTFFVITNKIIVKRSHDDSIEWLNTKFYEKVFTEEEKKYIIGHDDYTFFRKYAPTYLYYPSIKQLNNLLGNVHDEVIEETNLAKELSKNHGYYDDVGHNISTNKQSTRLIARYEIRGIRPAMDLYIDYKTTKK